MMKFFNRSVCLHVYRYHEEHTQEPFIFLSCCKCEKCGDIKGPYAVVKPKEDK